VLALTVGSACLADPPHGYYLSAIEKTGQALRQALHNTIDDHRVIKYSSKNPDTADALA
jgi:endonuclease I